MEQPLRFGICTDPNLTWQKNVERWRLVEELGFDSAWNSDHLIDPNQQNGPYFEAWTNLAGLAAVTTRIRIGCLVTSNTFRHPVILAKMAVSVDHISSGRLDIGLGAGWYQAEHDMFGIEFPEKGELISRFREAVQLIDTLLRNGTSTFEGKYYQVNEAIMRPAPVQKPRPPLVIGAKKPRMLMICAQYADTWNSSGTADELRERNQILTEYCTVIGRDPGSIRRSMYYWVPPKRSEDPWDSVDAFQEVIGRYREAGINEFIIDYPREEREPVLERVAAEVIPKLRASSVTG